MAEQKHLKMAERFAENAYWWDWHHDENCYEKKACECRTLAISSLARLLAEATRMRELDRLKAQFADLREAAQTLVEKMDHVTNSSEYALIRTLAEIHCGHEYSGDSWSEEFKALRAAVARAAEAQPDE